MKFIKWLVAGFVFSVSAIALAAVGAATYTINATPIVVDTSSRKFPISVSLVPQAGVSALLEESLTPNAGTAPSSANWIIVASGVTSATAYAMNNSITAIRITRLSGASAVIGEVDWPY